MRIISGKARGTKLYTLEGMTTRPTLDRVKEALFNIIQNDVKDKIFLDLFSGSGAIGLEAASRGARKVILCDKSEEAINIINKNIEKTHMQDVVQVYNMDFKQLLKSKINYKTDYIYIDPPYNSEYVVDSIKIILEEKLIDENSIIIIETDDKQKIVRDIESLEVEIIDIRKYGRANIIFLKSEHQIRKG